MVEIYHERNESAEKQKDAFINSARTMEAVIASYVQYIVHDDPIPSEAVQQINANIIQQRQLLQDIAKYLPKQDRHLIVDYDKELLEFQGAVPESADLLHMQKFWNGASKALVTRNEIISKLQS